MNILKAREATPSREYNCDLRRLVPWVSVADGTPWGAAVATVHAGDTTTPHAHDEDEVFLVLAGVGTLQIGEQVQTLERGDFVSIPRGVRHCMTNAHSEPLEFLSIYWGEQPRYFAAKD